MKRASILLLSGLLMLSLGCAACGNVDLVKEGRPLADIVVDKDALSSVKLAAGDLQKHLELMSGAKLPIVNAPSDNVGNHIYVGQSEFTRKLGFQLGEFKNSGFEIVAKDNYVILAGVDMQRSPSEFARSGEGLERWHKFCGEQFGFGRGGEGKGEYNEPLKIYTNDDPGTWYAVSELLEQLGVRFYAPYDNGTVIPEKKTIDIAEQHRRKEAKFARREFNIDSGGAQRNDAEAIAWFKRLKMGNNNIIIFNHTTDDIFSSEEQKALHPEYLACDADGKPYSGYPDGHGMPRYTDPGFRKAAVIYMNKMFEAIPELSALSIGPPDGGIKMDARDVALYGKPTDSLTQKASQYVWDFHVYLAKELKKSHPDKYLLYTCGAGADEIPDNIVEFPDNIIKPFAQEYSAYMVINSTARATLNDRKQWFAKMKTVKKCPIWDYYLYYWNKNPCYPIVFTEYLQREAQEMLPYSDGKFIEIQPGERRVEGEKDPRSGLGVPGLVHLMVYWQSKLFWDPDMDRKRMLDEYYELFFGPAKAEMKEFYEFAEAVWTRQESRSVTEMTGFLKEADVERYFDILKRAQEKAGKDTVYDKRIAQIEDELAAGKTFFASLKRTGPTFQAHKLTEVKIDGDVGKYPAEWRVPLRHNRTGELPATNKTDAILAMAPDNSALIVAVICYENQMDKLKADCKLKDTFSIFDDDVVEVYVNTPERSYFKIVVNPNEVIWDETTDVTIISRDTLPILWNPGTKAVVKRYDDRWTVEMMIPTGDFGKSGPTKDKPWGIEVGRTRFTGGDVSGWSISPTAGPYRTLNRWGNLYVK